MKNEDQPSTPEPIFNEEAHVVKLEEDEDAGSFSPELLHGDDIEKVIDPQEDRSILERNRKAVLEEQQRRMQEAMAVRTEDNLELKAIKAMEKKYSDQVHKSMLTHKSTGGTTSTGQKSPNISTECTQDMNGTSIIKLITTTITLLLKWFKATNSISAFTLEKDGDSAETCIIRFHASPPYKDIAFRVVNKEWEYSPKKGYKNTFQRGILHVYFNFKRLRYRG